MKTEKDITDLLSVFRKEGGDSFVPDENAIRAEYEKKHAQVIPLAIQVLSILGGILGTLFLLAFLLLAGLWESGFAMSFLGIVFIAAAVGINCFYDKPVLDTTSVALYAAGFGVLGFGISEFVSGDSTTLVSFIFILLSLLTLFIVHNFALSFLAVLIINGSIMFILQENHLSEGLYIYIAILTAAFDYLLFKEAKIITLGAKLCRLYRPVRIALLFSLIGALIVAKFFHLAEWTLGGLLPSLVAIAAILYLVLHIVSLLDVRDAKYLRAIYTFVMLLLLPAALFPALPVSLMIILLSFRFNYKTGFVAGILSFIYFAGQFYYDLNFTLLVKSILMIVSGVLFLLFFLFTRHKLTSK